MKTWKWLATASAIALSVGLSTPTLADVSIDDVVNDAKSTNDVVTAGLGGQGQRHSPLTAINAENIGGLVPAWTMSLGGEKMRGQETQPLVKDGVMYVQAGGGVVADSDPEAEFMETVYKSAALFRAAEEAQRAAGKVNR